MSWVKLYPGLFLLDVKSCPNWLNPTKRPDSGQGGGVLGGHGGYPEQPPVWVSGPVETFAELFPSAHWSETMVKVAFAVPSQPGSWRSPHPVDPCSKPGFLMMFVEYSEVACKAGELAEAMVERTKMIASWIILCLGCFLIDKLSRAFRPSMASESLLVFF